MIPDIQNMIFPALTRGVEDTARTHGFMVILVNTDEDIEIEKTYINKLRFRRIDGFIIASMTPRSAHIIKLRKEQTPLVLTLRSYNSGVDAVVVDNRKAAYKGVSYLIERGHRRIAIALGDAGVSLYADRYQGYKDALEEYRIPFDPSLVMNEQAEDLGGLYTLTQKILEQDIKPDAIFAANDARAIVIMRAVHDAGCRIPEDISIIGFDNVDIAALVEPPLSTIAQPLYEIGSLAAERLIYQIQHKETYGVLAEPVVTVADTHLVVRKSTK
jgi:LacI family transcriptional regulator